MSAEAGTDSGADGAPLFLRDLWYMAGFAAGIRRGVAPPHAAGRAGTDRAHGGWQRVRAARHLPASRRAALRRARDGRATRSSAPIMAGDSAPTACARAFPRWSRDKTSIRRRSACAPIPCASRMGSSGCTCHRRARKRAAHREPPNVGVANARPRWRESQTFRCAIDHAVIGLMDPAHAPYVHGRWWWRDAARQGKALRAAAHGFRDDAAPAEQGRLQAARRRVDRDHLRDSRRALREHPWIHRRAANRCRRADDLHADAMPKPRR